jgi:peptidoglycan glycosyltransferase
MPAVLADQLTTMMTTTATTTRNGTSAAARGIRAAIVSGTGAKDHALFTAFAPAYNPEVAVGVVLEHAPPVAAVPIVHALIEAALS